MRICKHCGICTFYGNEKKVYENLPGTANEIAKKINSSRRIVTTVLTMLVRKNIVIKIGKSREFIYMKNE